ncbi:MAG: BrnT family toxin [Dehalococcoidia bacterium]|nr:BrnT family toxin [Dehalococcoidia bacterium]
MQYEWDETKRQSNLGKHRIDFTAIHSFEWDTARIELSYRGGENRYTAIGYIGDRLHYVVYTKREDNRRIISLRKANRREERRYAQT